MDFNDIVSDITRVTKRPDKLLDAQREVNAAVIAYSTDYDYARGLLENSIVITTELSQALVIATSFPRLRKIAYIKRGGTRQFITQLSTNEMFSSHPCDTRDKYYIQGSNVNINMKVSANTLDVGWYEFPATLTNGNRNHWMLEGGWHFVRARALARVFDDIGNTTEAQKLEQAANRDYGIYRAQAVAAGG